MNTPTEPGPYWWREKDGDEWEIVTLSNYPPDQKTFWCVENCCMAADMQGQWAKAHNPDDVEQLRSKARAYDGGVDVMVYRNKNGKPINGSMTVIRSQEHLSAHRKSFELFAKNEFKNYTFCQARIVEVQS